MEADQGKRPGERRWAAGTPVTDSTILDVRFVTESLERDKFGSAVFDPARGIINGLLLGGCGWAIVVLTAVVIFG